MVSLSSAVIGLNDGLALTPPLGWRSYNAFGGNVDQPLMEAMMDAMVDRSRLVEGRPTSLADLGYNRVGLDGGWNRCFADNNTFHLEDGTPVWNSGFPNPKAMVDKAHRLGLLPGWYLNNCGCAENAFEGAQIETIMQGSVRMLAHQGWDGVKLDSCSQFHNLSRWAELINATGRHVMIENCHQGAYTPGMVQWQGYLKNGSAPGGYAHFLGMFHGLGDADEPPLRDVSFAACRTRCSALGDKCGGFTFAADAPAPAAPLEACYLKARPAPNRMDLSNDGACAGSTSPSDCPYHLYRVSGDIFHTWASVLANLEYVTPFLGQGGVHPPYPQGAAIRSRPGGWAYPDMLEVGNLANATEDRTHFAAWAIISSPLILSFNLSDAARMARAWPIISNRALLAVNQRWAGAPGRRLVAATEQGGWQAWAKPLGRGAHALLLMATGASPVAAAAPLCNVSAALCAQPRVCVRDLYTGAELPSLHGGGAVEASLPVHDSLMVCVRPASPGGGCELGGCPGPRRDAPALVEVA